ncbi:23S rRNA (adenine(2030)-N(6))-methyltransferase RlmJ [Candidatus Enterovibrio altilux]
MNALRYYFASPKIARSLLRNEDYVIFTELHPTKFKSLF